jgi:GDP-L-fucose synthase
LNKLANLESLKPHFHQKTILVTGGTGLIGREVSRLLLDLGASVKVVSLDKVELDPRIDVVFGDLTNLDFCMEQTNGIDFVFHLAGVKGSIEVTKAKPASFLVPLLMFNTNVLEASRRNGVKKLVYTSSIGAYSSAEVFIETENREGPPQDMFPGWAKRIAELQIQAYQQQYGLDWAVVRPCNVYGPGDNFDPNNAMVIPSLMMRIANGEKPLKVWGDGSAIRDFAYSTDVAIGTIQALHYGTRGDFVNLGSGDGYTIRQLVETMRQFIDFEYEFDATKPAGFPKRVMDISRAREWIKYSPETSLRQGLENTWNWFLENKDEYLKKQNYFK